MTRDLRLVLLAICAVSLPSRPLKGQPVHRQVESVETMVDRATRVVVARVAQVSLTPDNRSRIPTELTVDEVLKGDRAQQLSVGLPYHESQLARWRETGAPLLVSVPLDTSAYPVVVDLADSTLAMMTADFVVLRDSGQVMRAVREAIGRPPPEADRVSGFALTVPPESVVGTPLAQWRLWLSLSVPIDARLESRALAILRGEQPFRGVRVEAVNALRHFRSDSNVRVLTALLADTATGLQQRAEDNMGREIRVYPVRQAAHAILTSWDLSPPEPVIRIETYSPELAEVVDLANKAVTLADLDELRPFVNLRFLVLRNVRLPAGAFQRIASLESLRELVLAGSNVVDADLGLLTGLGKLETLDLAATGITDAGVRTIAAFGALKTVSLLGTTRVTDTGIAELRRLRPDLTVYR